MKFLLTALALLFAAPASAQGTLTMAGNIQSNANGQPLAGALLYTYVINTVASAQLTYQDINLTIANPWPLPTDLNGRLPFFYVASGNVHARLTDATGAVQFDYPNLLVIGGAGAPSGGGGQTVDPTTVASTGDVKYRLSGESLAGWVILNGLTIGNAASGATGFASGTAQALFIYLWTNCPNTHCPVTPGGRGATALADFSTGGSGGGGKQLQLPDMRDSVPVGRDCMGNSCLGGILLSNITSGGSDTADTPGAFGGVANRLILETNLPNVTDISVAIGQGQGDHNHILNAQSYVVASAAGSAGLAAGNNVTSSGTTATAFVNRAGGGLPAMSGSGTLPGGAVRLPIMNPFKLGTWYCKL